MSDVTKMTYAQLQRKWVELRTVGSIRKLTDDERAELLAVLDKMDEMEAVSE